MKSQAIVWLLIAALAAGGCGGEVPSRSSQSFEPPTKSPATPAAVSAAQANFRAAKAAPAEAGGDAVATATAAPGLERKIIYNADLELGVEKFSDLAPKVGALAQQFGGFVASSDASGMPGQPRNGLWRIRVPAARFQPLLDAIRALGEIRRISTNSDDVSEEFYDVEARMRNKRQEETRLLKLLEDRTGKLDDVLAVEREIARVRGEVEQLEGRLRMLTDLTSLSTVTLRVEEIAAYQPEQAATFGARLGRSFKGSLGSLVATAEALAVFIAASVPWLAVLASGLAATLIARRGLAWRRDRGVTSH
jgi:hypothetical protein